ncbi:MAG: Na/Pi cotransporter family protein [Caldisericaceae bacterium]
MVIQSVFLFLGGIALFIYGITITSKSFETFAFGGFRKFLDKVTARPILAVLLGTVFTSIIQSSSATTVTVVSLANSGTLSFESTLGIIFGANIGTTATAQIIAFNFTKYSLIIFAIGFFLSMIPKKELVRELGRGIMGFGLIFIGMQFMEQSVAPLKNSPFFIDLFVKMSKKPILGVLVSAVFTGIEQSSSVTVGIVQALGAEGLLDLKAAFSLVIGANIGTTVTAILASLGTNTQARRAAISHVIFNLVGAVIFLIIFKPYVALISKTSSSLVRQIANAHTMFNIICTILFLPFIRQYAKLIKKLVPGEEVVVESGTKYIDKRLLNMPSFAIDAMYKEVFNMFGMAKKNLESVCLMVSKNTNKLLQNINLRETAINQVNKEIQAFAPQITSKQLTSEQSKEVNLLVNVASQIERIGDILKGISELQIEKMKEGILFSDIAMEDITKMIDTIRTEYEIIENNFDSFSFEHFRRIEEMEQSIDDMEIALREAHVERLVNGVCSAEAGIIYVDMLSDLERISDHIYKIARLLKEKENLKEFTNDS